MSSPETEIPESISIGDYHIKWNECGTFQQPVYQMLAIYLRQYKTTDRADIGNLTQLQKDHLKLAGVVEFLQRRLAQIGGIKGIPRNLYDLGELPKYLDVSHLERVLADPDNDLAGINIYRSAGNWAVKVGLGDDRTSFYNSDMDMQTAVNGAVRKALKKEAPEPEECHGDVDDS